MEYLLVTKRLADEKPEVRFPVTFDFPPWKADKINKLSRYSNWKAINIAFSAIRIISYRIQQDGEVGVTKKLSHYLRTEAQLCSSPAVPCSSSLPRVPRGHLGAEAHRHPELEFLLRHLSFHLDTLKSQVLQRNSCSLSIALRAAKRRSFVLNLRGQGKGPSSQVSKGSRRKSRAQVSSVVIMSTEHSPDLHRSQLHLAF